MEVKLLLTVFMIHIQASLSVWQRVTVMKGQTLQLRCPITNAHKTTVEWRNPKGHIMFFKRNRVLKDKRYRINRLSVSEFTISISNITFKDGGIYTCSHYGNHTIEKKVEVTVLGYPKIDVAKHEGELVIKCTAAGNHHPPQISWKMDHGPEFLAHAQVHQEEDKFVSMDMMRVVSVENRVTVKCFARHPALHSSPLVNFVKIGPKSQLQGSTEVSATMSSSGSRHEATTAASFTPRDMNESPPQSPNTLSAVPSGDTITITASTRFPVTPVTSTDSRLSTTGWSPVTETTEEIVSYNSTERNTTGSINDPRTRRGREGSSVLLVVLVTCLIFCLLVVVVFFAIKLRSAHNAWRKENEDSDPSEDSSKSKSSQEDKNSKEQRRRGLFNIAFTQYVTEEPVGTTSNTGTMTQTHSVNMEQACRPHTSDSHVKETEL